VGKQLNYVGRNNLFMLQKKLQSKKMNLINYCKIKVNSMEGNLIMLPGTTCLFSASNSKLRKMILINYYKIKLIASESNLTMFPETTYPCWKSNLNLHKNIFTLLQNQVNSMGKQFNYAARNNLYLCFASN
jgi:hypothetical protein